jgi:hypothetical protein
MFRELSTDEASELRNLLTGIRQDVQDGARALRIKVRDMPWNGEKRQAFRTADSLTRISGDMTALLWQLMQEVPS